MFIRLMVKSLHNLIRCKENNVVPDDVTFLVPQPDYRNPQQYKEHDQTDGYNHSCRRNSI